MALDDEFHFILPPAKRLRLDDQIDELEAFPPGVPRPRTIEFKRPHLKPNAPASPHASASPEHGRSASFEAAKQPAEQTPKKSAPSSQLTDPLDCSTPVVHARTVIKPASSESSGIVEEDPKDEEFEWSSSPDKERSQATLTALPPDSSADKIDRTVETFSLSSPDSVITSSRKSTPRTASATRLQPQPSSPTPLSKAVSRIDANVRTYSKPRDSTPSATQPAESSSSIGPQGSSSEEPQPTNPSELLARATFPRSSVQESQPITRDFAFAESAPAVKPISSGVTTKGSDREDVPREQAAHFESVPGPIVSKAPIEEAAGTAPPKIADTESEREPIPWYKEDRTPLKDFIRSYASLKSVHGALGTLGEGEQVLEQPTSQVNVLNWKL